jgi:hypothetical protein
LESSEDANSKTRPSTSTTSPIVWATNPIVRAANPIMWNTCARGCKGTYLLQQMLACWLEQLWHSLRTLFADSAFIWQHCIEVLCQVSGDLKHLYRSPWGPENQPNFPIHLGLECIANFIFMVLPRKFSQIVLKFGQGTR